MAGLTSHNLAMGFVLRSQCFHILYCFSFPVISTITAESAVVTVTDGAVAELTCSAAGDPTPVITWFRNGTSVPNANTPRYQLASGRSTLVLEPVSDTDEGPFQCVATNLGGRAEDSIELRVYSK